MTYFRQTLNCIVLLLEIYFIIKTRDLISDKTIEDQLMYIQNEVKDYNSIKVRKILETTKNKT